jgi:hypothetical protein
MESGQLRKIYKVRQEQLVLVAVMEKMEVTARTVQMERR